MIGRVNLARICQDALGRGVDESDFLVLELVELRLSSIYGRVFGGERDGAEIREWDSWLDGLYDPGC